MILKLVCALILIESGGVPTAIGDNGRAVGLLQIHPIMVAECNRIAGEDRWTPDDRNNPTESIKMCTLFLSYTKSKHPEYGFVELGGKWNGRNPKEEYLWKLRNISRSFQFKDVIIHRNKRR